MGKMTEQEHAEMVGRVLACAQSGDYDKAATLLQNEVFEKIHGGKKPNSFVPDKATSKLDLPNGGIYVNDIEYGKTYPNSFLDIWYVGDNKPHPTLIHAHGGGYLFGDKMMGDPIAGSNANDLAYFSDFIARGYNVVTINYCFATEYRAPAQILQYNEMIDFLIRNATKLGLDMNSVVLMGSSAGANFSAIYSLCVCNHAYAAEIGFTPAISKKQIKCVVIDEMSLDPEANCVDWIKVMAAAWFGDSDILHGRISNLLNVPAHVKEDYLPSYIISSNIGNTFYKSAKALYDKLATIGIEEEMYYVPIEKSEPLGHGFMGQFHSNKYAKECYEGMHRFLRKYLTA